MIAKRLFHHVEAAHCALFVASATLGVALLKDYGFWIFLAFVGMGLFLALSAAHAAYVAKSTALVDRYEDKFFGQMLRERKSAALFLLGENSSSDELEDVLDFFECPVATKVAEGCVDAKQIYDTFYDWIRLYYQASKQFLTDYRKTDPAAYGNLSDFYAVMRQQEEREIKRTTGRKCTLDELLLSPEKQTQYLRKEANLKVDSADWDKIFRRGK